LGCQDLHHEIELGVVIGGKCKRVSESESMKFVAGYVLALDMTARDFQVVRRGWLLKIELNFLGLKSHKLPFSGSNRLRAKGVYGEKFFSCARGTLKLPILTNLCMPWPPG